MRIKTNWGFCTLRFFEKGGNGLRIQIFWPWLRFKKTKLSKHFGLGFDYQYDKP